MDNIAKLEQTIKNLRFYVERACEHDIDMRDPKIMFYQREIAHNVDDYLHEVQEKFNSSQGDDFGDPKPYDRTVFLADD